MDCEFIELRDLDLSLIRQIIAIEQDAFKEGGMNSWFLPPFIRHGRVFLLVNQGLVLAAAEYMRNFTDISLAYLFGLAVKKEYRNQGLGYKLLNSAHYILQQDNITRICLTVDPNNKTALRLYTKLGFRARELLLDEYGDGIHRQVLELSL